MSQPLWLYDSPLFIHLARADSDSTGPQTDKFKSCPVLEPLTGEAAHCQTVDGRCLSYFFCLCLSPELSLRLAFTSSIFFFFFFSVISSSLPRRCTFPVCLPFLLRLPQDNMLTRAEGKRKRGLKKKGELVKAGMSHLTKMESRVGGGSGVWGIKMKVLVGQTL